MRHEKIFDTLHTVAVDVGGTRSKHAAAIVHKGSIISIGTNNRITHPFQKRFASNEEEIWIHAELDAINKALKRHDTDFLKRCSLYVIRVKNDKKKLVRAYSKPCANGCQKAIATFGIKRVAYTTDDGVEWL